MTKLSITLKVLIIAATALVTTAAHAELPVGWYAPGCPIGAPAKTKTAAKKRCKKARDVVEVTQTSPAFWVSSWSYKGASAKAAVARCVAVESRRTGVSAEGKAVQVAQCRSHVAAVYGPFKRKKNRRGFDDETIYNYLDDTGSWVDKDGISPCFVAGTMVSTPDGDKAIETIKVGDRVLSWSPEAGRTVEATVSRTKRRVASAIVGVTLANGTRLETTPNHPFWSQTRAAWVEAGKLKVGEVLSVRDGERLLATAIVAIAGVADTPTAGPPVETDVWDLTVVPTHTYFAGGVWVHNY